MAALRPRLTIRARRAASRREAVVCMIGGASIVIALHAVVVASAGDLQVAPDPLDAFSASGSAGAPVVVTCDNFDGADATLAGRSVTSAATCGSATWTVRRGAWSTVAGAAASDATVGATATLAVGAGDRTVAATVAGIDPGDEAGLVLAHDGDDTYLAGVLVGDAPDRVELRLVQEGGTTVLTGAPVVLAGTSRLAVSIEGTGVRVAIDGVEHLSHTLAPAEAAALVAGTGAGLFASSASVSIDDLGVTAPAGP